MPSRRQRIVSYGIPTTAAATIVAAALLTPWARRSEAPPAAGEPGLTAVASVPAIPTVTSGKHQIDVVFAVDTTGSMGGLLDGAKRTVWSIATHIRKADPEANLRIGLVAYRDVGDEYVTRPFSLTTDLDAVYSELSTYQAAGGGDTPEDVDAALDASLKMSWRPGAKKLIFVVGDAPPSSRGEVPTFDVLAQQASARGIIVNAIRCGQDAETAATFQRLASLGRGEFSSISQDGGVQQIATPYDDRLAELSTRIDRTTIIVGDDTARAGYMGKMAAAEGAPAPAKADRAAYYAKKASATKGRVDVRDAGDLVGAWAVGGVALEELKPTDLPAELRSKDKAALEAELTKRSAERQEIQKELEAIARQRDEYLAKHAAGQGFDAKVKETIERQLK